MALRNSFNLYAASLGTLALGVAVYVLDRPVADVYMLPAWLAELQTAPGGFHDSLPSLFHAFAFSLLLLLTFRSSQASTKAWVCASWWLVEAGLEGLQHGAVSPTVAVYGEAWLAGIPVLQNLPG